MGASCPKCSPCSIPSCFYSGFPSLNFLYNLFSFCYVCIPLCQAAISREMSIGQSKNMCHFFRKLWRNKETKPTSSRPGLVRCIPGPMITLVSGNNSTSLLYMSTCRVAVTKRYCVATGEELIKLWNADSKSSSLKSISTSSKTALRQKVTHTVSIQSYSSTNYPHRKNLLCMYTRGERKRDRMVQKSAVFVKCNQKKSDYRVNLVRHLHGKLLHN